MTNLEMVAAELDAAKKKHPKFCDSILDELRRCTWEVSELAIKNRNTQSPYAADNIIMEELAEAFAAYEAGDLSAAVQELAQCAAVCIRAMEYIEKEMEETK